MFKLNKNTCLVSQSTMDLAYNPHGLYTNHCLHKHGYQFFSKPAVLRVHILLERKVIVTKT